MSIEIMESFRRFREISYGLWFKIVLMICVLFTIFGGFTTYFAIRSEQDLIRMQFIERAEKFTSFLKENITDPLIRLEIKQIRGHIKDLKRLDQQAVKYVYVLDSKGRLVSEGKRDSGRRHIVMSDPTSQRAVASDRILKQFTAEVLDIALPILLGSRRIGTLRVGFFLKPLWRDMNKIRDQKMVLGIALTFLAILITSGISVGYFFVRDIANPLATLTEASNAIARGEFDRKIDIRAKGELAILVDSFNTMIDQLQLSRKSLEEKNQDLEALINIASHDLKTPLVNIVGFSGELEALCKNLSSNLSQETDPETIKQKVSTFFEVDLHEDLKYIVSGASKMDVLLSGLLRFSRLGRDPIIFEELKVREMFDEIVSSMQYQIRESAVTLQIDDLPDCLGDRRQVDQIFSNLLDNAVKYLDSSRPGVISISAQTANAQTIYCVRDNGIGISEQHRDKIFEIFYRVDPNAHANNSQGLGLTIARRVLDRMGGNVRVESEPGKGSSFFVSLPSA